MGSVTIGNFAIGNFATNMSVYLRNGARYGHSYYKTPIGTRHSIAWFPVTLSYL